MMKKKDSTNRVLIKFLIA